MAETDISELLNKLVHSYNHGVFKKDQGMLDDIKKGGQDVGESSLDLKLYESGNQKHFTVKRSDGDYSAGSIYKISDGWYHISGFGSVRHGKGRDMQAENEMLKTIIGYLEKDGPVQVTYETQEELTEDRKFFDSQGFNELDEKEIKDYAKARGKKISKIDGTVVEWDAEAHGKHWKTGKPYRNVIKAYHKDGDYSFDKT